MRCFVADVARRPAKGLTLFAGPASGRAASVDNDDLFVRKVSRLSRSSDDARFWRKVPRLSCLSDDARFCAKWLVSHDKKIKIGLTTTVLLCVLLAGGCGESYVPFPATVPGSSFAAGQYPLRTDFLVVGKTGLDGAPKHWSAPGYPPLKSAQLPRLTPDTDLAEDIRKQLGRTVVDPTSDLLTPPQKTLLARLLERTFGIPAEPLVAIPNWNDFVLTAVARPKPNTGLPENIAAIDAQLKEWDAKRWKNAWTFGPEREKRTSARRCRFDARIGRVSTTVHAVPRSYRRGRRRPRHRTRGHAARLPAGDLQIHHRVPEARPDAQGFSAPAASPSATTSSGPSATESMGQ